MLGDRDLRANLTESLLRTPPVITVAESPTIFRNSSAKPSGAVITISSTTFESDEKARSTSETPSQVRSGKNNFNL